MAAIRAEETGDDASATGESRRDPTWRATTPPAAHRLFSDSLGGLGRGRPSPHGDLFAAAFEHAPNGLALFEFPLDAAATTAVASNHEMLSLLGRTRDELAELRVHDLIDPRDHAVAERSLREVIAGASRSSTDVRIRLPDGRSLWTRATVNRVPLQASFGLMIGLVDISARKELEDELRVKALHDPLTGLPNRRLLDERLAAARARTERTGSMLAVIFLDLNRFKDVNDTAGHAVGDRALITVADRLRGVVRPTDTLARVGGDEFVIVCDSLTSRANAEEVAARASAAMDRPIEVEGQVFDVSVAIGIVTVDARESGQWTASGLLQAADEAMYHIKHSS